MIDGMAATLAEGDEEDERSCAAPAPRVGAVSPGRRRVAREYRTANRTIGSRRPTARPPALPGLPMAERVLYLNIPADPHRLRNIREFTPDTNEDKALSDTTQYACFERNADGSVFVGASGSKASPLRAAIGARRAAANSRSASIAPAIPPKSRRFFHPTARTSSSRAISTASPPFTVSRWTNRWSRRKKLPPQMNVNSLYENLSAGGRESV